MSDRTSLVDDLRELADNPVSYGQETHGELHTEVLEALGPLLKAHAAFPHPSYPGAVTFTADHHEDVDGTLNFYEAARAVVVALTGNRPDAQRPESRGTG